jgi:hypothetical protein
MVSILGPQVSAILSRKVCICMCPIPNGFRDRVMSLYTFKIVDKKEILRTVVMPIFIVQVTKLVQYNKGKDITVTGHGVP